MYGSLHFKMERRFKKVNYDGIQCSVILATKLFVSFFILLYFGGSFVVGNKDIPCCHEIWKDLGNDMVDWRERCLDGDNEINSPCCQAEKEYFEERRRSHRKMCFYEGPFPEPYLLAVSETRIAVVDITSNYSTVVIDERERIENLIIDPVEANMYFKSGTDVYRANFDGSDKEVMYRYGIRLFAFDWVGRRMFWVNSQGEDTLFVGNVNFGDGINFRASENKIGSLAVDPNTGYIFSKNGGSTLTRTNFIGEDRKKFNMKDVQSKVYLDYVNKKLYYYRKSNTSIDISFLDYDGVLLKKISFPEGNVSAFTVFGDFLYLQKMDTRVIQEMNVSTGVVYRNISLPKAFPRLIDLAIVERSQYPTDGCPISPCGVNEYCSKMNGNLTCKCVYRFKWNGSSCEFRKDENGANQGSGGGFFVKHVQTGMCIHVTSVPQVTAGWGKLFGVELSNNCLDPAVQFRFLYNSAMFNLERQSCFEGKFSVLYFLLATDTSVNCRDRDHAITQTSWGGLSVYDLYYKQTPCAVPKTNTYIGLTTCSDTEDKRFNFGSVICHGNIKSTNCPKDQYMVVMTASYRGLSTTKTCGLSDDYSCEVDVTCRVKKQCDGQHECNITVNETLFSGDPCPGMKKYLYFEYQCSDTVMFFNELCVDAVSLSYSSLPNEGFVKITTDSGIKNVCWQSLGNAKDVVCRQLGYKQADSLVEKAAPSDSKDEIFSGSIVCNDGGTKLSQCRSTVTNSSQSCSTFSYLKCHICPRPLLGDKQRFPDSLFTASASSEGHNASDARISSGSSWCAPVSNGRHYLQVDFGRLYVFYYVAIFGDSTSSKWVVAYNLNYTLDSINWRLLWNQTTFQGNKIASNDAAIQDFLGGLTARAFRFTPLSFDDQPCMRIEICGTTLLPDKPTNLTVTNIKSRSAEISWLDPENTGVGNLTGFWIQLKKENSLIQDISEDKNNECDLDNLTPYTTYKISVAVRHKHGFGEETITSFLTLEEAPEGPPLNVTVIAQNSSSLSVTWEPPEKDKRNGIIVSYTVCISHEESKPCFKEQTTEEKLLVIASLNVSTKYYVRVLASTKVGRGPYSESTGKRTNGKQPKMATNGTETTLTFPLQIPSHNFTHFYVVSLKLKDGKKGQSPDSYENNDLVTYAEAKKSSDPKPYIAAVVTSKDGNMFILGDGRNTSDPTSRRRRSTSSDYYNGPLEPGTSYSIFQRIFINNKGDYYSTEWSPASKTVGKETLSEGSNVGVIVGAIVGVCVLLILVTLAIIMFRRRKGKQHSQPDYQLEEEVDKRSGPPVMNDAFCDSNDSIEVEQNANDGDDTVDDRVEEEVNNTDPETGDVYANKESIAARVHKPIPVEEFNDHVNHLRKNNNKEFKLDFEDLPTGRISNWDTAKQSFNIPKNRYGNAVTYNHSRVILSGDENTDYINASFIDGLTEKYYIATQGPKPKTVNDFWRMVFEHKCPTIVMLTTLNEMGKTMCEKYWPEECGMYGDIKVTAEQTKTFADYVIRTFVVEKGGEQHEVQQFHFVSWPDYGVPLYPTQILTFRRHFKSFHETKTGPAVIHCSAGVGRSGVFIAVDKLLDDLDKEKKDTIDIFGFVKDMRTRRVNMVQTAEQYVFIHDAIVDHLKCGANEVEATQITIEIKNLLKKNDKGETGFDEKFKRLNTVKPQLVKEKCEAALLDENRKKNRKSEIYPSESGRPYLKYIDNVENSDYINACYVDGYLGKRYFIATQTPLAETINDFWRMVLQHKSSTIVMLNQLREGDEEYPMFWPTQRAKPQSFGPSTVMLDSFVKKENIVIRKFVVSEDLKSEPDLKEGRMVRLIQYMSWPDHGVPKDVDDIAKILSEVEESQRAAEGKGPVTVICSDGAGRSGTYIAISNLVDRVKVVQVIDVFQCIKLIRTNRPQFVETAAQFKLCYDAVTNVLRSFEEYSNLASDLQNYSTSFV